MSKGNVLIVEDEWLVAESHRMALEDAGYSVVGPASSVRQAVTLIQRETVHAAVLDIGLNGETSADLVPHLSGREIPFVFVSGYAQMDLPKDLRDFRILPKPLAESVLIQAVRDLVDHC